MKKLSFILFVVCLIFASCSNDDESSQQEDAEKLDKMYNDIITASLVNSETCTNPEEWNFTTIDSKACGGYGYVIYSKKINIDEFLEKIKKYTAAQNDYNQKWGIVSDCSMIVMPTGIECFNEKPKLYYSIASALKK